MGGNNLYSVLRGILLANGFQRSKDARTLLIFGRPAIQVYDGLEGAGMLATIPLHSGSSMTSRNYLGMLTLFEISMKPQLPRKLRMEFAFAGFPPRSIVEIDVENPASMSLLQGELLRRLQVTRGCCSTAFSF